MRLGGATLFSVLLPASPIAGWSLSHVTELQRLGRCDCIHLILFAPHPPAFMEFTLFLTGQSGVRFSLEGRTHSLCSSPACPRVLSSSLACLPPPMNVFRSRSGDGDGVDRSCRYVSESRRHRAYVHPSYTFRPSTSQKYKGRLLYCLCSSFSEHFFTTRASLGLLLLRSHEKSSVGERSRARLLTAPRCLALHAYSMYYVHYVDQSIPDVYTLHLYRYLCVRAVHAVYT